MAKYIYQHKNWTNFTWDDEALELIFGEVRHLQGKIAGQMSSLGFSIQEEARLATHQARSSIARRLGLESGGLVTVMN